MHRIYLRRRHIRERRRKRDFKAVTAQRTPFPANRVFSCMVLVSIWLS